MKLLVLLKGSASSGWYSPPRGTHTGERHRSVGSGKSSTVKTRGLRKELNALRPQLAAAAQKVYDGWEQDEEGIDVNLGTGGICDEIQGVMDGVVWDNMENVGTTGGTQPGAEHASLIVYDDNNTFLVDIPYDIYEYGYGYNWTKKEGATIKPNDVEIREIDREDVMEEQW